MTAFPCPSCGTSLRAGVAVCPKCGTNVAHLTATGAGPTSVMAPHDTPTLQYTPPPTRPVPGGSSSSGGGHGVTGGSGLLTQARLMDALKSATLGEYEILAELGRGGMATVYLAHDISLDRKVAIKVMSPALLDGEGAIERFKREARTAGALSHPHIIPIYAVKDNGELLYFVMKFVEGRPLDDVLQTQGGLPIPLVVQILTEVAGALAFAHRKGVVHRDVKPANIMLDDGGWAVVTDFGIAKVAEKKGLTLTGSTVGTPAYMSPEQCSAGDVNGRSDQYSLGIVGYELLTGKVPFNADSLMGMFMAQMNDSPPPLLDVRPDCPKLLANTIDRMMAKKPEERWPVLEDVVTALGPLQKKHAPENTRVTMAALARESTGRPRADDFTRPESPSPVNVRRQSAPTVSEKTASPKRSHGWAWAAITVPVVALITWLALKGPLNAPPGSNVATQQSPSDASAPAQQPGATKADTGANKPTLASRDSAGPGTKTSVPTASSTKTASARDSVRLAGATRSTNTKGRTQSDTVTRPIATATTGQQSVQNAAGNARTDSATPAGITPPVDPNAGAPTFSEISAGGSTTCGVLTNDAGVVCWGAASVTGAKLEGVLFSKVAVGDGHTCGLTPSGEAFCWGTNSLGQLGDGTATERPTPTAVKATQRFTDISVGAGHTCALTADGTALCWGGNKNGQLGDGSRSNRVRPVVVRSTAGNQGFQSIAAGGAHTCGITRANKAFCWGDGFSGQVGNAMQDFATEPFAVKTNLAFRTVVAGDRHTCGLTTNGRVYCWGENKQGQLGNETKDDRNVPDSAATDQVFRVIAAGGQHTCGIATTRQLLCWGNNQDGRLGDGTRSTRIVPVVVANGQTFAAVSAGSGHTCAITTKTQAMCWGGNARGQLGGGNTSAYSAAPVVVKIKG